MESSWYFRAILHYREKMGNRILKISNVKKTIHYLQKNGLRHAFYAAKERIEEEKKTEVKAEEIKTADIKAETQKEDLETPKTEEKKKAAPRKSTAKKAESERG